jgi:hypothetical protein
MSAPGRLNLSPRRRVLATVGVIVAAMVTGAGPLIPGGTPAASAADPRLADMATPSPFRGMIYTGLSLGKQGSACQGVFEAKSRTGASLGCSHGPDPGPPGTDVRRGRADHEVAADLQAGLEDQADAAADGDPDTASAVLGSIGCLADGSLGSRVQAIYAVADDRTDRSATVIPTIRATYAPKVDWQINQSAAETGGEAHVRFVTEPGAGGDCQLSVPVAHLTAGGDDSFSNTVAELKAQGYNQADRKYLVWTDANVLCGVGSVYSDTRPGLNNINNGYAAMFARVDAACWDYAEGHELMHTLGSVQRGAPHATANGHCYDESDEMCYDDDGSGPTTMQTICAGRNGILFDCNHDDYFYAGVPPASNWLATHWNTFNSSWLLSGPLPTVAVVPPPTGSGGGTSTNPAPTTTTTTTTPRPPSPATPVPPQGRRASGYWMLTADGHVHPFGDAAFFGQAYPLHTGVRAVHLEPTPTGGGYWVLDDTGQVRAYGEAVFYGSVPAGRLDHNERAVSLSATPTGQGYWVFTTRGRVVSFGDAGFFGDVSSIALNRPVIGSVATTSGLGYYLFASDGGIFTFGDASFFGSTGAMRLNRPVVAMAVSPERGGYWLVGSDGGLFAFGAAGFYGSMGAVKLNRPVSAVVPGEAGYLMVGEDGGAFSFGDVDFFGSLGGDPPATPVVSVALRA